MPRQPRYDIANHVYHVINRSNNRVTIFNDESDYLLLEQVLVEAKTKSNIKILAYCNMPNHIHFVLLTTEDKQVSKFMHWFTTTFTQRWHVKHKTIGTGHLFQGRYKSFVVEDTIYLLQLLLYVERNPLRAGLVYKSEEWRWSSLWIREFGTKAQKQLLSIWPIEIPTEHLNAVNELDKVSTISRIRYSVRENLPLTDREIFKRRIGRPKNSA
jgi:putative transposase